MGLYLILTVVVVIIIIYLFSVFCPKQSFLIIRTWWHQGWTATTKLIEITATDGERKQDWLLGVPLHMFLPQITQSSIHYHQWSSQSKRRSCDHWLWWQVTSHMQSGSVAIKREMTIADNTGYKIQATLWGKTTKHFEPQLGKAVIIENALIKSYWQNVTISVNKIMYADQSGADELEMWYERQENEQMDQLSATPKHQLGIGNYKMLNAAALPSINNCQNSGQSWGNFFCRIWSM